MRNLTRTATTAAAALVGAFSLSGCTTTQFGGYSNAPLAQVGVFQHPRANGGVIPPEAFVEIITLHHSCLRQARPQVAGPLQAAITGGVAGAAVGAASVGTSVDLAFHPVQSVLNKYFVEGAVQGGIGGAYSGAVNGAVSAASTIGACTRDFWNLSKAHDPEFKGDKYWGTVVETISYGKAINARPPALDPNSKP